MSERTPGAREQAIRARLASHEGLSLPPNVASDLTWLLDTCERLRAQRPEPVEEGLGDLLSELEGAIGSLRWCEHRHATPETRHTDSWRHHVKVLREGEAAITKAMGLLERRKPPSPDGGGSEKPGFDWRSLLQEILHGDLYLCGPDMERAMPEEAVREVFGHYRGAPDGGVEHAAQVRAYLNGQPCHCSKDKDEAGVFTCSRCLALRHLVAMSPDGGGSGDRSYRFTSDTADEQAQRPAPTEDPEGLVERLEEMAQTLEASYKGLTAKVCTDLATTIYEIIDDLAHLRPSPDAPCAPSCGRAAGRGREGVMSAPDYSPADVWALMVERVMGEPCVYYEGRDCRDRGLPETWCDRCELLAAAERVEVTEGSAHGSDFVATTTVLNPELSAALLTMRKDAGDE